VALASSGCGETTEVVRVRAPSAEPVATAESEVEEIGCSTSAPVRRAPPEFDDTDPGAVTLFHDVLAPYGSWIDDARLGLVWTPTPGTVPASFVPYATHGRWSHRAVAVSGGEATVEEYVWVSDLPWGWVTFHYGRWTFAGDRGWAWVAGRRYAGAWVDWRVPDGERAASSDSVIGWGPTPPRHLWRVSPGPASSRSRFGGDGQVELRAASFVAVPYVAFATPYAYARTTDLFRSDLGARLLTGGAALEVAHATRPAPAPRPEDLGIPRASVPAPPSMDRGLQQAWMLATPASASAVGAGPELGSPPRLRTYVTGGPRWTPTPGASRIVSTR